MSLEKRKNSGCLHAEDMAMQSDHLASKSEEGDSWLPLLPVIQLPLGCHLAQADWQGFKSKEETAITLGELQ